MSTEGTPNPKVLEARARKAEAIAALEKTHDEVKARMDDINAAIASLRLQLREQLPIYNAVCEKLAALKGA